MMFSCAALRYIPPCGVEGWAVRAADARSEEIVYLLSENDVPWHHLQMMIRRYLYDNRDSKHRENA